MRLKSFLMALVAYSFSFTACTAGEKVITYPELPLDAQRLIEKYFQKADGAVASECSSAHSSKSSAASG